uniref:Uncharacterized protein n=1 Tax=Oscillatoriales cyanobacterium SpSt-402 TaxID=2282168 RepID=A0A832H128_9CYAN
MKQRSSQTSNNCSCLKLHGTIKPLLEWFNLSGNQPLKQQFSEAIARLAVLKRVLQHFGEAADRLALEPEFYRYQESLIKGEISCLETEIDTLQSEHPNLRIFAAEQFKLELLAFEADPYAEFVCAGQLNRELAPFL